MECLIRWETASRYYIAHLHMDLLGDWVISRAWGGKQNNLGKVETMFVQNAAEGMAMITQLKKERAAHHYQLVNQLS